MRILRAALLLLPLAAAGCAHLPCWCDDPDANPARPGKDGTESARILPGRAAGYDSGFSGRHSAGSHPEERTHA